MTAAALRTAERLIAEAGLRASVAARGHDHSVAVISAAPEAWPELLGGTGARLAREIRALGFSYVAIDLAGNRDIVHDET